MLTHAINSNQLFYLWSDGTWRNFQQNQPVKQFDSEQYPSVFIGKQVPKTADIRRRMVVFYELTKSYRPSLEKSFCGYLHKPSQFDLTLTASCNPSASSKRIQFFLFLIASGRVFHSIAEFEKKTD